MLFTSILLIAVSFKIVQIQYERSICSAVKFKLYAYSRRGNDTSKTFDRIQMTKSMTSDYTTKMEIYRFDDVFDVKAFDGPPTRRGTANALSDHCSVWVDLYIDRDNDTE